MRAVFEGKKEIAMKSLARVEGLFRNLRSQGSWTLIIAVSALSLLVMSSCGGSSAVSNSGPTVDACGETTPDADCHTMVVNGTTRAYLL
jgi:hypothetical protein